ncbi:MAG: pilin [Minisyncoccia bacterium]
MKYLIGATLSLFLFIGLASFSFAQDYQLLQPLPIGTGGTEARTITPTQYISGMFMLIIGIAGVLAVIMIIVGGIKYMTTDAMGAKSDAKKTIQNAIFGLLLALGAWIILYSIGGDRLTNFTISLDAIPAASTTPPIQREPWPDDSALRRALLQNGITVQRTTSCLWVGQTACTSLSDIGGTVIAGLGTLRANCPTCMIVINGGTEYWLHGNGSRVLADNPTDHRPGGGAVDLDNTTTLNRFVLDNGQEITGRNNCSNVGPAYRIGNAIYVNEFNHWHVCY